MKNFTQKAFILFFSISFFMSYAQEKNNNSRQPFNQSITPENQKILEETGFIRCATVEYENFLREKYPNRATTEEFENWIAPKIQEMKAQRVAAPDGTNAVITIPVVVHVIHNGEAVGTAPNITDAQVESQITVMTEDFRRMLGTPGYNTHLSGADVEIEFCLAQQDPNGYPTDGINRVNLGQASWSTAAINSTVKPTTQWDPTKYMNMWSVDFTDNTLLGYAQFPSDSGLDGLNANGGAANTDGVVAVYSTFGSMDYDDGSFLLNAPYDRGRTMTHEVGHWLGLRHIWGDTSNCTNDDYCADTPDASDSNGGCPTVDSCPLDGLGNDMVENYMDYTNDTCMNIYTNDQKTRIDAVMANSPRRVELITSIGCTPGQSYDLDGSINIDNLNLIDCVNSITPDIEITNRGNNTLTSATINYYLDSNPPTSIPWTGNLATNESVVVALPAIVFPPNSHTLTVELISPNGGTDEHTANNIETSAGFSAYFETIQVHLTLLTDTYAEETSWEFKDSSDTVLYSFGPYNAGLDDSTTFTYDFDVVVGECYTFTINDTAGDGICCNYGVGSYSLTADDATVIFSGGEFTTEENTTIGVNTLGVNDYFINHSVSVYPNPASAKLTIKLSNYNLPDGYTIYNMLGQIIANQTISNVSDLEINTSTLRNGMYFVKISKDNASAMLPFIKN